MAQQHGTRPRFEDAATADVTLRLLSTNKEPLILHLHSQVLRRSEFFEARLSERWNLDSTRPLQLTLADRKNIAACKRCIELMYAPKLKHAFTSVQDALDVLEEAAELLFHDCINACLCFLECVPWTPEDEVAIRSSLASCDVEMTADLAARLLISSGCTVVEIMEDRLRLFFPQESPLPWRWTRDDIKKELQKNFHPSLPSDFADVTEVILHKEWHRNVELLKAQPVHGSTDCANIIVSLEWLLEVFLFLKIGDDVVKTLAEEDILKLLAVCNDSKNATTVLSMLKLMLREFQSGELIISRSIRLALVKNWLPIISKLVYRTTQNTLRDDLEAGICALIKTLPQVDQSEIFKICSETCFQGLPWPNLRFVFELSGDKLRQELQRQQKEQESSVKDNAIVQSEILL